MISSAPSTRGARSKIDRPSCARRIATRNTRAGQSRSRSRNTGAAAVYLRTDTSGAPARPRRAHCYRVRAKNCAGPAGGREAEESGSARRRALRRRRPISRDVAPPPLFNLLLAQARPGFRRRRARRFFGCARASSDCASAAVRPIVTCDGGFFGGRL